MVGIAGERTHRYRFLPVFSTFILTIAIPKIFFGYSSFEASIVGIAELLFQFNNFVGLLMFWIHDDSLKCLIACGRKLTDEVFNSGQHGMVQLLTFQHKRMHKFTKYYCMLISCTGSIYACGPMCATFWSYYRSIHTNSTVHHILQMEENFYGLAIRSSFTHYLLYAVTMAFVSYVCAYVGIAKILACFNFINYCILYFELVALKLQNETQRRIDRNGVRAIVTMHQQTLYCARLLEMIVSPLMLMQVILCVLMSSSMILYFTFGDSTGHMINIFIILLVVTTETLGYCYLGTRLSMQSTKIAHIAYSANWEQQSTETMKNLQLIMLRAQAPIGITAGKFCYIDMERFTMFFKIHRPP
ncbi:odorant receptor 94a-like [Anopheles marshallii]|uniref:odorant receptor 94a-like n=1 Tax=Anopheles marshallii TaxID=1521116 RepID=UPI00237A4072|nr:odorant receptor 94a-like [Anopheles marshallii]